MAQVGPLLSSGIAAAVQAIHEHRHRRRCRRLSASSGSVWTEQVFCVPARRHVNAQAVDVDRVGWLFNAIAYSLMLVSRHWLHQGQPGECCVRPENA